MFGLPSGFSYDSVAPDGGSTANLLMFEVGDLGGELTFVSVSPALIYGFLLRGASALKLCDDSFPFGDQGTSSADC